MTHDVEHIFIYLVATCVCSLEKCLLYPDRGIPPNTTGATDRCKNSEELYYKLEQELSSHNSEGAPPAPPWKRRNRFYTVRQGTREGKLKGIG